MYIRGDYDKEFKNVNDLVKWLNKIKQNILDWIINEKLQDLLKDIEQGKVYTDKDRKPFKVNEDGHTDVPSAIRKLKLSIEDSQELLQN